MKIGILGTRGIPNAYGGFEQFAEYLSLGLVERGEEVWVYNAHNHPYRENIWNKVHLIHCFDPEYRIGEAGQFIYDLNCILDARKRNFDILLQLGYTSSAVWHRLLPGNARILTNMDGLEWKRSKYSSSVQRFLKYAEKLAVNSSDLLVADSAVIQEYLSQNYTAPSVFIPYGAEISEIPGPENLAAFGLKTGEYYLLIARMQADNHVEEIIQGVLRSADQRPLFVVGNVKNKHGKYLINKYASDRIRFPGSIFDQAALNLLRYHSRLYFHGHSAGGTNPSLLEAMAARALICAHDNAFNRSVLLENALFFRDPDHIAFIIDRDISQVPAEAFRANNLLRLRNYYTWDLVIDAYHAAFKDLVKK